MDIRNVFDRGLDLFGTTVHRVDPDSWDTPSPCEAWTARELTGHVIGVMGMASTVLRGGELTGLAPPAEAADPVRDWDRVAESVRVELATADLEAERDTVFGRRPLSFSLAFPAMDLFLHSWDLGRAAGNDVRLPDDIIDWIDGLLGQLPEESMRSPQVFGPEQPAPPDADRTTRLMAFSGRKVSDWPAP